MRTYTVPRRRSKPRRWTEPILYGAVALTLILLGFVLGACAFSYHLYDSCSEKQKAFTASGKILSCNVDRNY